MWGPPTRQAIAPPRSPGLEPKWPLVLAMALERVVQFALFWTVGAYSARNVGD